MLYKSSGEISSSALTLWAEQKEEGGKNNTICVEFDLYIRGNRRKRNFIESD